MPGKYGSFKYNEDVYGQGTHPNGAVTWKLQVDWDGSGTVDAFNEAIYMTDFQMERGRKSYLSAGGKGFEHCPPGRVTITLDNYNGRYNPYNVSSPLYGNIKPGRLVEISAIDNSNGDIYRRMTGTLQDIRPIGNDQTGPVRMTVLDFQAYLNDQIFTLDEAIINTSISDCYTTITAASLYPISGGWAFSPDDQPVFVFYLKDKSLGQVCHEIADAAIGSFFISKEGQARFYARNATQMSTWTLDESILGNEIAIGQPWDIVENDISCVAERTIKKKKSTVWWLTDPVAVAAGATITLHPDYAPAVAPVVTEIKGNTLKNGKGTDITGDLTWLANINNVGGTIDVTNDGSVDGYVTKLVIEGKFLGSIPTEFSARDASSVAEFGQRRFNLRSPYLQDKNFADAFADILLAFLKDERVAPVVKIYQRPATQFPIELMDKIHLTSSTLGIDDTFSVMGISERWAKSAQETITTLYLQQVIYDNTSITHSEIDEEIDIPDEEEGGETTEGGGGGGGGIKPPVEINGGNCMVATATEVRVADISVTSPNWYSKAASGAFDGAIVDADVALWDNTGNTAYVITDYSIYRTENLQASPATWLVVYDIDTDPTFSGLDLRFMRVLCCNNFQDRIYVLAYARQAAASANASAYLLRSVDGGDSFRAFKVADVNGVVSDFYLDSFAFSCQLPVDSSRAQFPFQRVRHDGDPDSHTGGLNPWAVGYNAPNASTSKKLEMTRAGYTTTAIKNATGTATANTLKMQRNSSLSGAQQTLLTTYINQTLDAAYPTGWSTGSVSLPKESVRVQYVIDFDATSNGASITGSTGYVIWRKVSYNVPRALDYGRKSNEVVYVGTPDKIYQSLNGGGSWTPYITQGANDIHCPQDLEKNPNDQNVMFWGTDGTLYMSNARTPVSLALTESAAQIPLRIATHAEYYYPIMALQSAGFDLDRKISDTGGWTEPQTAQSGARCIRMLIGESLAIRKTYYLTSTQILYSTDDGTTVTDVIGNFSSYASPVVITPFNIDTPPVPPPA